jgi:hypothetical protein
VKRELAAVPNKEAIVAANPNLTKSKAHAIAKAHRQRQRQQWKVPETERWFNSLVKQAREAIADEKEINNVPATTFMKAVEPTLFDTIEDGAASRIRLVNYWRSLFKEETAGDEPADAPEAETADKEPTSTEA